MAAISDLLKNETTKGVLIGVAAAAVTFALFPLFRKAGKPLARAAVKTGIILYEKTRETAAEIGEIMEDLVAEAQAELKESATFRPEPEADQKTAREEVEIEIQ
jgi:hypothetical protein